MLSMIRLKSIAISLLVQESDMLIFQCQAAGDINVRMFHMDWWILKITFDFLLIDTIEE